MRTSQKNSLKELLVALAVIALVYLAGRQFYTRFDLTSDNRYTLSQTSFDLLENISDPLEVTVFLEGEFPGEFKKLQVETQQLLEEFRAYNPNVQFRFIDPLSDEKGSDADKRDLVYRIFEMDNPGLSAQETQEVRSSIDQIADLEKAMLDSFTGSGMTPARVTMNERGRQSEAVVFPWALASYNGKTAKIPLLKNMMGATTAEKVVSSVQHLEYAFVNAFNTVSREKEHKIAVLKGNGQLHDLLMGDFIRAVRENYFIGTFTLDSVANSPQRTLEALKKYDLAIMAKPTQEFSDAEKQVLDQYIINGGKTLWLMDQVAIEMDSLYNETASSLAFPRDLGLTDMFFKYGVRINPTLVKDIMATPISLATGEQGSASQYTQYPWFYSPMIYPQHNHPIVNNIDALRFEFANSIDTLKNNISKTVLLSSSPYSRIVGTPVEVRLDMVSDRPDPSEFQNTGNIPVAVLLEGRFSSVFQNRIRAFEDAGFKETGTETKMIVISDGDLVKNQLDKNFQPLELGFDKWTNNLYANKEFLMNCVNYLLDDGGLINIRSKEVDLPLLDPEKVYAQYNRSQWINIGGPLVVLGIFGLGFFWIRKRRYAR